MARLICLVTAISLSFIGCSDAPGPDAAGGRSAGQPSASPTADEDEPPCGEGEPDGSLSRRGKREKAIYVSVIKRAINEPVLRSTRKLNIFDRAPRKVGNLQTKGRKIDPEIQAAIIESLDRWSSRYDLSIRFCSQPTLGRWLILGSIKEKSDRVSVDTATQGGSMELLLARKQGRWVVTGVGRVLNY